MNDSMPTRIWGAFQQFWIWAKRQNHTNCPNRLKETQSGDKIQLSVEMRLVRRFIQLLLPYSTVLLRNFIIGNNPTKYEVLSYTTKKILFTNHTVVEEIFDFNLSLHGLMLSSFSDILNGELPNQ